MFPFPAKGIILSTSRTRRRLSGAAAIALSGSLVLSACGSRVDDSGAASSASSCVDTSGSSVKAGFLNSLSGTMAISEKTVSDSMKLAAEQINDGGGVLGKKLDVVQEDGASEPTVFAEKAKKLSARTA